MSEVSEHTAHSLDSSLPSEAGATHGSLISDHVSTTDDTNNSILDFTDDDEHPVETINPDNPDFEDELTDLEPIWLDRGDPRAEELDDSSGDELPQHEPAPQESPPPTPKKKQMANSPATEATKPRRVRKD